MSLERPKTVQVLILNASCLIPKMMKDELGIAIQNPELIFVALEKSLRTVSKRLNLLLYFFYWNDCKKRPKYDCLNEITFREFLCVFYFERIKFHRLIFLSNVEEVTIK